MGDARKTGYNLPIVDLTEDNISSNSLPTQDFDLTRNIDTQTNRRTELIDLTEDDNQYFNSNIPVIDLTKDDNQYFNSNIPVIDLTSGNDQAENNIIPVIDLTDDDIMNITDQIQCIDLTDDSSSSRSHTNRQFDLTRNYDRDTNRSTNLTDHDNQNFNPNAPVINFTSDNDKFASYRIPVIVRTHDDVQDITHQLQYNHLTDGKQQPSINYCIPTTDLTYDNGQSIDQTIPASHLTSSGNHGNYRRPIFDLTCRNTDNIVYNIEGLNLTDPFTPAIDMIRNDKVIREPVAEMYDAEVRICNNLPTNFQKSASENNSRIHVENPSNDETEYNILKCTETSNRNMMHIGTSSSMQQYQSKKGIILTDYPLTNNFEDEDLIPGKFEKNSQNNTSDLLKPARHPIPFRHSLGRSTINTSQNVPIECTEASEGGSRTITVSSTFRRKKWKSSSDISKLNLSNSSEPSTSRADAYSFGAFKEFFLKFCVIFIFLWIFFIFIWYFTGF